MNRSIISIPIKEKIHTIREVQVVLDRDLADLYEVGTKVLNQAVKRNIERFPEDFMFQLTEKEKTELVTECDHLKSLKYASKTPYAFTEHGVAALSGILRSKKANQVNIQVIRTFVAMRRFIAKNAEMFQRLDSVERKQFTFETRTEKNFKRVFDALQTERPKQGIFFDGQIFDAHRFISGIIRSAEESIILLDNFIDDSVLTLFTKRKKKVKVIIYTKNISKQLRQDLQKYNSQHEAITIKEFKHSHDRFMIIDNKTVYHIGASLKDLGKKWFAFSRFDRKAMELIENLNDSQ